MLWWATTACPSYYTMIFESRLRVLLLIANVARGHARILRYLDSQVHCLRSFTPSSPLTTFHILRYIIPLIGHMCLQCGQLFSRSFESQGVFVIVSQCAKAITDHIYDLKPRPMQFRLAIVLTDRSARPPCFWLAQKLASLE